MSEDNLYLLFCYLIFGLTLVVLTVRSKNRLKTLTINLIVSGLYSGLFFYNLTFNSSGGSGLVFDRGYFNFFQKTMKTLRPVPHTVISQIPTIEIVGLGTLFVQLKNRTARS
jgi:hypothetical protein